MLKTKTSKIVCATLAIFFLVTGVIMLILTVAFKDQLTQDKSSKTNLPGKKMPQSVEESTTAEEESTGNEREKTEAEKFVLEYLFVGNIQDGYVLEFNDDGKYTAYKYDIRIQGSDKIREITREILNEANKGEGGTYRIEGNTLYLNEGTGWEKTLEFVNENQCEQYGQDEYKYLFNAVHGVTKAFCGNENKPPWYLVPVISKNVLNDPADRKESFSGTTDATTEQSTEDTTQATTEEETKKTATISGDEAKEKAIEYYKNKYTSLNEHNAYIKAYSKTVKGVICYEITVSRINADDKKETDSKTIYVPHDGTAAFELSEYNVKRP